MCYTKSYHKDQARELLSALEQASLVPSPAPHKDKDMQRCDDNDFHWPAVWPHGMCRWLSSTELSTLLKASTQLCTHCAMAYLNLSILSSILSLYGLVEVTFTSAVRLNQGSTQALTLVSGFAAVFQQTSYRVRYLMPTGVLLGSWSALWCCQVGHLCDALKSALVS